MIFVGFLLLVAVALLNYEIWLLRREIKSLTYAMGALVNYYTPEEGR